MKTNPRKSKAVSFMTDRVKDPLNNSFFYFFGGGGRGGITESGSEQLQIVRNI